MNMRTCFFICFVLLFMAGCELESTDYPPEPTVEFKNAEVSYAEDKLGNLIKKVELQFYLIDGDGNIGLSQTDTVFPFTGDSSYNFFPTLYVYDSNEFVIDTSIKVANYKIPSVGDLGQDNTLKADIFVDFEYTTALNGFPYDSIMYSFYVLDRSFNKSNVEWTDTIVFPDNGP